MVHGAKQIKEKSMTVVLGVIGNDIHIVGNKVLEQCLREWGYRVLNIGANRTPKEFACAAAESDANAVLIGSLNGEALHWSRSLRTCFEEAGVGDLLIYMGGNLLNTYTDNDKVDKIFADIGINRVFNGYLDFNSLIEQLDKDLNNGSSI